MSLHKFLNFNKSCPICDNSLTLYMQWIDAPLFKAIEIESNDYYFAKYNPSLHEFDKDDDSMTLSDYGDIIETSFSLPSLLNEAKRHQIYFYFLCKEQGFAESKNLNNYEINLSRGCYYRSTPLMEFIKRDNSWKLSYTIQESSNLIYKDEAFCLKTRKDGVDKIYMLSRDIENQTTKVWYFAITDDERKDPKFRPNVFRKELPLLINRPCMDNKKRIINKLENWILLS